MILTLPSVAFTAADCLSFSPLSSIYVQLGLQIYQILREWKHTSGYNFTDAKLYRGSANLKHKVGFLGP